MTTAQNDYKELPKNPGVYFFKDKNGTILYVGKAKNLRNRVSSYFTGKDQSPKTQVLVRNISDIDYIVVDSEIEALLLENKLIKQHSPKYNIDLKDAKTYAYILVTNEKYPRILSVRKPAKKGHLFGPYVDGGARAEVVRLCIKLFNLRVCKKLPKKACLNYHIGICTAPCINNVSEEEYSKQVKDCLEFLNGNTKPVLLRLESEMKLASDSEKYEIALEKKKQIESILHLSERQKVDLVKNYDQDVIAMLQNGTRAAIELFSIRKGVISGKKEYTFELQDDLLLDFIKIFYSSNPIPREIIVNAPFWTNENSKQSIEKYFSKIRGGNVSIFVPERGEKLSLVKLAEKNALLRIEDKVLIELQEKLILPEIPRTIECFDMSNLGSEHLVGAMTQWINGKPNKEGYRRFEIKSFSGKQNDFEAMKETVYRRYKRLKQEGSIMPNLIVIDGGPIQLDFALHALRSLGLTIPIISIAKEKEEIYTPHDPNPKQFDTKSPMMLLLRAIRDSVHNFVISYNRKKRSMKFSEEIKREA